MKKPIVLLAVVLFSSLLLAECGREGPVPPADTTPPVISSTIPSNGSVNVPIDLFGGIEITFSELMDASTINDQTIVLANGQTNIPGSVAYTETSGVPLAVFTPVFSLNPTTLYTLTVKINVKDTSGNPIGSPYVCSFETGTAPDTTPPSVTAAYPASGTTGVVTNIAPSATFSEPVNPATIVFTLSTGGVAVAGSMAYSGMTAIFSPSSPLAYGTQYMATVNAGVKDLAGNAMPNNYFWSFTTGAAPDTTPPFITANTPAGGATGVAVNIAPSVTFSEPVDPATITFTLSTGGVAVAGTMSYSGTTAVFTPSITLLYNTQYTASVSAGVKDLAGNVMPNGYFWSFMTGTALDMTPPSVTATNPAVGATGVAVNIAPSVTFSEPVDPATITFTLSAGSVAIPCTMSYSGTIAIFTPSSKLNVNTLYTARVSAGVRDLAGNAMPNDYFWSFSTSKK